MTTPPPTQTLVDAVKAAMLAAWGLSAVDYGRPLTEREAPNGTIDHAEGGGPKYVPEEDAWDYALEISGAFPMKEGTVWASERDARFAELLTELIDGPDLAGIAYLPYLSASFPKPGEPRETYEVEATLTCRVAAVHH